MRPGVPGGAVAPTINWSPSHISSLQSLGLLPANFVAPGGGPTGPPVQAPPGGTLPGNPSGGATMSTSGGATNPDGPVVVTPHGAGWKLTGTHPIQNVTGSGTATAVPTGTLGARNWFGPPGSSPPPWWDAFQTYIANRFPQHFGGPQWRPPSWLGGPFRQGV